MVSNGPQRHLRTLLPLQRPHTHRFSRIPHRLQTRIPHRENRILSYHQFCLEWHGVLSAKHTLDWEMKITVKIVSKHRTYTAHGTNARVNHMLSDSTRRIAPCAKSTKNGCMPNTTIGNGFQDLSPFSQQLNTRFTKTSSMQFCSAQGKSSTT